MIGDDGTTTMGADSNRYHFVSRWRVEGTCGEVADVLIEPDGKTPAVMVSVGGFLGIGEKDVAVPFNAVRITKKDNKTYLVLNATKDALKSAPGFKYDREKTTWVPDTSSGTVGAGGTRN